MCHNNDGQVEIDKEASWIGISSVVTNFLRNFQNSTSVSTRSCFLQSQPSRFGCLTHTTVVINRFHSAANEPKQTANHTRVLLKSTEQMRCEINLD